MAKARSEVQVSGPSHRVLQETPLRALVFLRGRDRSAALRSVLAANGFCDADRKEGLRLIAATCPERRDALDIQADERARAALAFIHDWAGIHLRRLRAAVERLHPEHRDLFDDLDFADEGTAAVAVARWLERVASLGDSAADRAVLATLVQRAVGPDERARLAGELRITRSAPFAGPPPDDSDDIAALTALHAWFTDWATTARSVVKRKDWLILLGLAERRRQE